MHKRRITLFWIKLVAFLCILGVVCDVTGAILGAESITEYSSTFFHIPRNSVDVIWLGTSHQFCGILPQLLFDERGITSAISAGIEMDLTSSYWQLKHLLLTQRPELVVVELYPAIATLAYAPSIGLTPFANESRTIDEEKAYVVTAYTRWLPILSPYKAPAILEDYLRTGEDGSSYFKITKDHQKIARVGKASFSYLSGKQMHNKNFGYSYHAEKMTEEDFQLTTYTEEELSRVALDETNVAEMERIIALCKQHDLQLIFSVAPMFMNAKQEKRCELLEVFAQKHGVPFVGPKDFTIEDMDCFRDVAHLNYLGAERYTAFWNDYLPKHYDLPDHRNSTDARYAPWQERVGSHQEQVTAYTLFFLKDPSLSEYLEQVGMLGKDYFVLLSARGDVYEGFSEDDYALLTEKLGMTDEATEAWYNAGTGTLDAVVCGGKVLWSHFDEENRNDTFQIDLQGYRICFEVEDGTRRWSVDGRSAGTLKEGLNIAVYNLMDGGLLMDDPRTFDLTEIDMDDE